MTRASGFFKSPRDVHGQLILIPKGHEIGPSPFKSDKDPDDVEVGGGEENEIDDGEESDSSVVYVPPPIPHLPNQRLMKIKKEVSFVTKENI